MARARGAECVLWAVRKASGEGLASGRAVSKVCRIGADKRRFFLAGLRDAGLIACKSREDQYRWVAGPPLRNEELLCQEINEAWAARQSAVLSEEAGGS